MLATLVQAPFDRPGWIFEEKYDGYRILAYKESEVVTLLSRNGKDRTGSYAAIAEAIGRIRARTLLLDGEMVVFDRHRVSRFQLLQQGGQALYATFDCLYRNGSDLRDQPLSARRAILEEVLPKTGTIFVSRRLADNGLEAYRAAKRHGYEGMVAKNLSSIYQEGRSRDWLKVKVHQEEEFVIVGYTAPSGSRKHLGALLLGAYEVTKLRYVGKVGTGFSEKTLLNLSRLLRPLVTENPGITELPKQRGLTFVKPQLVAQIAFEEWTADKKLRQPVFLGLRDDKKADEVQLPAVLGGS